MWWIAVINARHTDSAVLPVSFDSEPGNGIVDLHLACHLGTFTQLAGQHHTHQRCVYLNIQSALVAALLTLCVIIVVAYGSIAG